MIYEDVYQFLMKQVSSKEFDVVLHLIQETGWDNETILKDREVARQVGTKRKYVKEIIEKFTSTKKNKYILGKTMMKDTYKVLIGKPSTLYQKGDHYCKKYALYYTSEFKGLSIYAKRILLKSGMSLSNSGQAQVYLSLKDVMEDANIPTKAKLIETIEEISLILGDKVSARLLGDCLMKEDYLHILFENGCEQDILESDYEKRRLLKTLFTNGYYGNLTNEDIVELLKTLKYMYNDLTKGIKKTNNRQIRERIEETIKYAYREGLKRFAEQLHKLQSEGEKEGSLSAYLSAVIFSIINEEMVKVDQQRINVQSFYKTLPFTDKKTEDRLEQLDGLFNIFEYFITKWVDSRIEKKGTGRYFQVKEQVKQNNNLKQYLVDLYTALQKKVTLYTKYMTNNKGRSSLPTRLLENVEVIIDTYTEKIQEI